MESIEYSNEELQNEIEKYQNQIENLKLDLSKASELHDEDSERIIDLESQLKGKEALYQQKLQ